MINHEQSAMTQPLLLLYGLLCDETIWADIQARLGEIADVRRSEADRLSRARLL